MLFVSHDRWFVSELATRILEVTADGPRDFPGTYADYLERCGDDHLDAQAVVLKAKSAKARDRQAESPVETGASWEDQKRRRNRLAVLPGRRDKVLAAVDQAEARRKAIAEAYAEPDFFARTSAEEVKRLEGEDRDLSKKIEACLAEWEQIEKEIALLETQGLDRRAALQAPRDAPAARIVRRDLDSHAITLGDPDVMNVQAAAALGEDGSAMSSGKILDSVEAASTALRDDPLENEKVTIARGCIYRHYLPRFGAHMCAHID